MSGTSHFPEGNDMTIHRLNYHLSHAAFSLAALAAILFWFVYRMEGQTFLTACLYLGAVVVYFLVRWKISPWTRMDVARRIDERKVRALNSTHFVVIGCLIGALVVLISANEVRQFAPKFTEERVAEGYRLNSYKHPKIRIALPAELKQQNQLIVIGAVDEQAVLLDLNSVMADVAKQGLDSVAKLTLSLFLLPCIGILSLRLFEAIAQM